MVQESCCGVRTPQVRRVCSKQVGLRQGTEKMRVWLSRCEKASVKAVANHVGDLPSGRLAKAGGTESWDVGMIRMRVFVDLNSSRLDIQCLAGYGLGPGCFVWDLGTLSTSTKQE